MNDVTIPSRIAIIIALLVIFVSGMFAGSWYSSQSTWFSSFDPNDVFVHQASGIAQKSEPYGSGYKITVVHLIPALKQNFTKSYYSAQPLADNTEVVRLQRTILTNLILFSSGSRYPVLQYQDSGEPKSIRIYDQPISYQSQTESGMIIFSIVTAGIGIVGIIFVLRRSSRLRTRLHERTRNNERMVTQDVPETK